MIREIREEELEIIEPLLGQFSQEIDSSIPPNFVEQIKSSLKEGKTFVYGAFDNNQLNGIGIFGNVSKRLSLVYAQGDSDLEVQLVDALFNNHSGECPYVGAAGSWVTEAMANRFVELGFRKIDRAQMTLDKISIESLEIPALPEGMKYEVYNSSSLDETAQLMFEGNNAHIDQIVFPNFFGSVEACKELIENIVKSVYGDYKEPYSWLLRENGKLIGACFMTIRNKGDTGYIPDIVIDNSYRGRKLGRALLVHSMKELLAGEPTMVKIDLDVTLENDAKFLYMSLGYETVREYSMFVWLHKLKS